MKYVFVNFIHTLRHYKASSLLNIAGMAVAFAAFYIILTQVRWGFGYNSGIEDADRIFLIQTSSLQGDYDKRHIWLCRPLAEKMVSSATGVESYGTATFHTGDGSFLYIKDGDKTRKVYATVQRFSQGALSVFGFEAEQGKLSDLSKPGTVAVSARFARENSLKVGDRLSYSHTGEPASVEIAAVWKDKFPSNSSPCRIDMLEDMGKAYADLWSEWSFPYFVKLDSACDTEAFEKSMGDVFRESVKSLFGGTDEADEFVERMTVSLVPLKDVYYRNDLQGVDSVSQTKSKGTDIALLAVAVLIILIAVINFVNFFFALVPSRVRSVNTYKVFGTSRATLMANFMTESVCLVAVSMLLAAAIVAVFAKSSAAGLLSAPVDVSLNADVLLLSVGVGLAGVLLASVYPALYITSFQPALVLKGSFGTSRAGRAFRNTLIGVQFTISIALIVCAAFVWLQYRYMMNFDMGFNRERIISGTIPGGACWYGEHNAAFENKLRANPDIADLTWADGQIVNTARMGWLRDYKDGRIDFLCYPVAYNFLDFMGIKVTEGRHFTRADELAEKSVIIFNGQARRQYGIALGDFVPGHNGNAEVVGFCSDFNFRPLQYACVPFAFYVFGKDHSWRPQGLQHIYVRTAAGASPAKVMDFIRNTALEVTPDVDPETIRLNLFDKELAHLYENEERLGRLVAAFTAVAVALSLTGVFGLVFFETQHRRKEIALRRVLGAGVDDILAMFCLKYSAMVLVCFVVAAPLCWWVTDTYFNRFAYHTPISWWVFAAALAVVLAVTVCVVALRSLGAAGSNPVESLKTE